MPNRSFIRHIVLFSAKDKNDLDRIVDGLSLLKSIPHADTLEVCVNRRVDKISGQEIDVVVYGEFADQAALDAYKAHPVYQESIRQVRPLRETRIAVDV